jgi:DnaD/phage-associated family protein
MSYTAMAEIGGFVMAPDAITQELGIVSSCVYGKIWRYERMKDGVCRASIATIADELGELSYNTILSHIKKLIEAGYIEDLTPDLKNRPHVYKTTGRLKIEIGIKLTPQKLNTTPQKLNSRSSKFADESESLIEELIENKDDDDGFVPPQERPQIYRLYEQNIGALTGIMTEILADASKEYPAEWLEPAFAIACKANRRTWAYVDAVLKNWRDKGYGWKPGDDRKPSNKINRAETPANVPGF